MKYFWQTIIMIVVLGLLIVVTTYAIEEYQFCQYMDTVEGVDTHFNWLIFNCEIWAVPPNLFELFDL